MAAMTALIVLAFVVPLALVVRNIQRSDEVSNVVGTASSLAAFIDNQTEPDDIREAVDRLEQEHPQLDVTVYAKDGTSIGERVPSNPDVTAAFAGRQTERRVGGGLIVYIPNNGPFDRPSEYVIRLEAPARVIRGNLSRLYATLGFSTLVAVAIAAAIGVAAARGITRPTTRLINGARELQAGRLDTRVEERGPPELRELARTLNQLAAQIQMLLARERESVADLAHRLRTPVTALALEVEALDPGAERDLLMDRVGRLDRTLDDVIGQMRRGSDEHAGVEADLRAVVRARLTDWTEVAGDRGRRIEVEDADDGPLPVPAGEADLESAIDVLLDNALTHTPETAPIRVRLAREDGMALLAIEDGGPGFDAREVVARGASHGGSTGLGLDIARRTAERSGGSFEAGTSSLGGARVVLRFPAAQDPGRG